MRIKQIIITGIASQICWWIDCVGQVCPVIDVYAPTGYIRIRVIRTERGFENEPYQVEGWIEPRYVEVIE